MIHTILKTRELNFEALGEAHNRAVVAVLNALDIPSEDEAEELVDSIVALVFVTMKQYLNEQAKNELNHH